MSQWTSSFSMIGATGATGPAGPIGGTTGQVLYNNAGNPDTSANLAFDGTTTTAYNVTVTNTFDLNGQIFYSHGADGFSVNENFNAGNATNTAYHFTSGSNTRNVVFSIAKTDEFTNMFGTYGSSAANTFVIGSETANNTTFQVRSGVGIAGSLNLAGGTQFMNLSNDGSVSLGSNAGAGTQGTQAVAIGAEAGCNAQGQYAVAIGTHAGYSSQGSNGIAIGYNAGCNAQGANAIAIGNLAGSSAQLSNSIILNASGADLPTTTSGLYIDPVRSNVYSSTNQLFYDTTTKEITYKIIDRPAFSVYLSNTGAWSDTTFSTVLFNQTEFDTGSYWDATLNRYSNATPGYYQVNARTITAGNVNNNDQISIRIRKNGTDYKAGQDYKAAGTEPISGGVATIVKLDVGDWIDVVTTITGSGAHLLSSNSYDTYFNGAFIRGL